MTFDHTRSMKLVPLDKATIVHKEPGAVKLSDLPAKMEGADGSIKKNHRFLNVIVGWEGTLDLKNIETLFLQQRYADLPPPISMKVNTRLRTPRSSSSCRSLEANVMSSSVSNSKMATG